MVEILTGGCRWCPIRWRLDLVRRRHPRRGSLRRAAGRFGRRNALVVAGVLQASGHVVWTLAPGFTGFAVGFVLWGLGGALVSGAQEALLYYGLAAVGAEAEYARVNGWVTSATLLADLPAAAAATVLFAAGGYEAAGWVSVGVCLAAAAVASTLPEPPSDSDDDALGGRLNRLRAVGGG